jgi:hypothetical protein
MRKKPVSLFDWAAGDNQPNWLGYRQCDPDRVHIIFAIMKEADEERARKAAKGRKTKSKKVKGKRQWVK